VWFDQNLFEGTERVCWHTDRPMISKKSNAVERKRYSLIHVRVSEPGGEHTMTIGSRKRLRLRDHFGTIDHVASVLSEDSELGHGILESFRHPILIVDI
jgi:hypothetical protein